MLGEMPRESVSSFRHLEAGKSWREEAHKPWSLPFLTVSVFPAKAVHCDAEWSWEPVTGNDRAGIGEGLLVPDDTIAAESPEQSLVAPVRTLTPELLPAVGEILLSLALLFNNSGAPKQHTQGSGLVAAAQQQVAA